MRTAPHARPRVDVREEKMKRLIVPMVSAVAVASLLVAGCSPAAPAPTPTKAPAAAPTKAPEATKPVAAPTTAPAKPAEPTKAAAPAPAKVDYPQKGKPIMTIVPWPPGNTNDMIGRLLSERMEKEFGTPAEVVNKPGAGTQLGMTDVARAKPDGHTLGVNGIVTISLLYLDPERKAVFGRKDFEPVAICVLDPWVLAVPGDSPYKTVKDLFDDARANPKKIKLGTNGYMTPTHMVAIALERRFGPSFAAVHFDSGPLNIAAMLGGHTDALVSAPGALVQPVKAGEIRVLGVMDTEENDFLPGAQTFRSQGMDVVSGVSRGLVAPGGTPKEIVAILEEIVRKATVDTEFRTRSANAGMSVRYMGTAEFAAHWDEVDAQVKLMMDEVRADPAKK